MDRNFERLEDLDLDYEGVSRRLSRLRNSLDVMIEERQRIEENNDSILRLLKEIKKEASINVNNIIKNSLLTFDNIGIIKLSRWLNEKNYKEESRSVYELLSV